MSLFDRIFRRSAPEQRAGIVYGPTSYAMGSGLTGATVTPIQAENLSTVTACVNAVSGGLAALPAAVYQSLGDDGRVEAPNHPVSRLLRTPNQYQTWPDWLEWTAAQFLLSGNALSAVENDGAGRPVALRPIPWQHVRPALLSTGALVYDVVQFTAPWGGSGMPRRFLADEVFHVKDRSDDGYVGRSRLSRAPDVLAAAIGVQTFSASMFQNQASFSGIVGFPPNISPDGKRRMEAYFNDRFTGAANAKKLMFADKDTTFVPVSMSAEDAELLASRQFTVTEICRLFNVPPPIVQDYSNNTFTNAATASIWFATNTLRPIARKIEAEFSRSVFVDAAFHVEIDLSGLMRGDFATRWTANVAAVTAGILTRDEVREAEGYGPLGADDDATAQPATPPGTDA